MTTLITGASGNIGRLLVADLLDRGVDLRALSRDPEKAALPDAVDVVESSLATVPTDAFDGVDAVFVFPAEEGVDEFVERAVAAGVPRFVVLSSLAVSGNHERDAGTASGLHHRAVEDAVTGLARDWTILRPGNFANNLLFWSFAIRSGQPVRAPYPTSSQVLIHEADIAAAAALALTGTGHAGRVYELTGPRSLTKIEQVAAISAAIGRDVPLVEVGPEEFRSDMAPYLPAGIIDMLLRYWAETVDAPEVPLPAPLEIPRTSLTQWAIDHRADFAG
jgi:uncharacterized protein YbjT (DUF2867 family)